MFDRARILNRNLTWTSHIDHLCMKLSRSLEIRQIKVPTDDQRTITAYHSLLESHIRNELVALGGGDLYNKLQRVLRLHKRAIRTLAGLRRFDSYRESFNRNILTVVAL